MAGSNISYFNHLQIIFLVFLEFTAPITRRQNKKTRGEKQHPGLRLCRGSLSEACD